MDTVELAAKQRAAAQNALKPKDKPKKRRKKKVVEEEPEEQGFTEE